MLRTLCFQVFQLAKQGIAVKGIAQLPEGNPGDFFSIFYKTNGPVLKGIGDLLGCLFRGEPGNI